MVTGLVVNKKVSVPKAYFKGCRAAFHQVLCGKKPYVKVKRKNGRDLVEAVSLDRLQGGLQYCYATKLKSDADLISDGRRRNFPDKVTKTYRDFLMFKYFFQPNRPIVVVEGVSDIFYINAYLSNSNKDIVGLYESGGKKGRRLFDFYSFPGQVSSVLGLSGGTGDIKRFLTLYKEMLFRISDLQGGIVSRRVVILLDNDKGFQEIRSHLKKDFGVDINNNQKNFHHVYGDLKIVLTPPVNNKDLSDIEDFIDSSHYVESSTGRKFTRNENYNKKTHFGKVDLGKSLLSKVGLLDISDMDPIFLRLSDAINS